MELDLNELTDAEREALMEGKEALKERGGCVYLAPWAAVQKLYKKGLLEPNPLNGAVAQLTPAGRALVEQMEANNDRGGAR